MFLPSSFSFPLSPLLSHLGLVGLHPPTLQLGAPLASSLSCPQALRSAGFAGTSGKSEAENNDLISSLETDRVCKGLGLPSTDPGV